MGSIISILATSLFQLLNKDKALTYQVGKSLHTACRSVNKNALKHYQAKIDNLPSTEIIYRTHVPDDKVSWSVQWPEYKPVEYTAPKLLPRNSEKPPAWADPIDPALISNWNALDDKIDRRSFMGKYEIVNSRPLNPSGRTGVTGRGQLGKWGPNHAADPVVTRWKKDDKGNKVAKNGKNILEFVSIQRLDTKEWAIPGGMCDPGENVSVTLKREFMEEAADSTGMNLSSKAEIEEHLDELFQGGDEIYQGYVDDPRNTDNAWMETTVYNFHDEDDKVFGSFKLSAGDDAGQVTWMTIDKNLKLYASHYDFVKLVVEKLNADW